MKSKSNLYIDCKLVIYVWGMFHTYSGEKWDLFKTRRHSGSDCATDCIQHCHMITTEKSMLSFKFEIWYKSPKKSKDFLVSIRTSSRTFSSWIQIIDSDIPILMENRVDQGLILSLPQWISHNYVVEIFNAFRNFS